RVPGGPRDVKEAYESEPIPAWSSAKFYRIHVRSDEVQAQAPRPHVLERPPAQLRPVEPAAPILDHDLEGDAARAAPGRPDAAERHLDRTIGASGVGVADDVREGLVQGEHHGAAFL